METTQSFARRCEKWLGSITPTIRLMPGNLTGMKAPGTIIAKAQGFSLSLWAIGYPETQPDGSEMFQEAEIWICADTEGDITPILALSNKT